MSNLDTMIENKENEVKLKTENINKKLDDLLSLKKTNGYFVDNKGANVNIFVQKDPLILLNLVKFIVTSKDIHDKSVEVLGDSLPSEFVDFKIENSRSKPVSFEEAISDIRLALEILKLKKQSKKLSTALYSLAKNYSDEKKKEIEVKALFKEIDEI